MKKLILIIVTLFTSLGIVNAGVVPGTIQIGEYQNSIYCTPEIKNYPPTGGSYSCSLYKYARNSACGVESYKTCTTPACGVASYNYKTCTISACGKNADGTNKTCTIPACGIASTNYKTCPNSDCGINTYKPCRTPSNGCEAYSSYPAGNDSYTNYTEKSTTYYFSQSGNNVKLKNDESKSCSTKATVNVTHISPTKGTWYCPMGNCSPSSISIYNAGTGRNAQCSTGESYDNLIIRSTFNQTSTPTWQLSSLQNKQSCKVEGRYATGDNTAPTASISGPGASVFTTSGNDNQWCNIKKYKSIGYTYKADENPGCEYYKGKNTSITSGKTGIQDDLLKGLEIQIPPDPSGIGYVEIQLGSCNGSISPINSSLENIIVSSQSASGVKPEYKNGFTLYYDTKLSLTGWPNVNLKDILGKPRLDDCLDEGKNSIAVLIKDMARSESNGTSLSPNTGAKSTKGTINIDDSTSKLQLSGDLTTTSLSGGTVIDGVTSQDIWRNFTLNGNIKSGEKYKGGTPNECKSYSGSLTGQCSGSLVGGQVWVTPSGVNPTTGKFMQFKCDNLGPFPTNAECKPGCPNGQTWNPNTNSCGATTNVCKAFVGGEEVVIENGVNGVVNGNSCMPYCIPGHSLSCVVK